MNFDSIASGKAVFGRPSVANWAVDNTATIKTYKYTPDSPGNYVTINGLATTSAASMDNAVVGNADSHNITIKAAALTNSTVTLSYPSTNATVAPRYTISLGADVNAPGQHEDVWKNQIDWVTSGGTATYKLYNKANYVATVKSGSGQVNYIGPTKGSAFLTITGLNTTASITSDDVNANNVITLHNEDLKGAKVALATSKVSSLTGAESVVGGTNTRIGEINGSLASYTLTLADDVEKSTVSNDYWDTTNTTAKLTGTIGKGYKLATNKKSVLYYSKDANGQTIATITGLKKNAEIAPDDYGVSDDPFITAVSLGSDQLTTTKVAIKGEGYKLVLKDEVLDDVSEWKNKVDWFASNGTFTYKTYNKAYYTPNALGTEITYTAQKDVQQHAVIAGLNKTVAGAMATVAGGVSYVGINTSNNVITLYDAALNKATKITLTDKDLGGYTLALATNSLPAALKLLGRARRVQAICSATTRKPSLTLARLRRQPSLRLLVL